MKAKKENKGLRKLLNIIIIIMIIIGVIIGIISTLPRPKNKQTLRIGYKVNGYRIMNHFCSYSYLTSIEEKDTGFEVKFLQYYNNEPYVFSYFIKDKIYIDMFSSKIPSNRNSKMEVSIGEDKRSLILKKCDLLNGEKGHNDIQTNINY